MASAITAVTTATMMMTVVATNKEICHLQPSSPASANHCPVTQTSLLTFVAVAMTRAVAVVVPMVMAMV